MESSNPGLILIAEAPSSLLEVCGVTLLDRLLRQAQRLGFREALILSPTPEAIRGEIARPSWARKEIAVEIRSCTRGALTLLELSANWGPWSAAVIVPGDVCSDIRLLRALMQEDRDAAVVDSAPPAPVARSTGPAMPLICGAARISQAFLKNASPNEILTDALQVAVASKVLQRIDAASFPGYIPEMRRTLRPFCLPVSADSRKQIEALVLDSAQKGTLDLPAYVHAPIETFIVSYLCRTSITPNGISIFGVLFGIVGTICFVTGHFVAGLVIALIFGLLDGLDGKTARVKVETTRQGHWEHRSDLVLEYSWWIALAWGLRTTGQLPNAFFYTALLLGGELLGQAGKKHARLLTGRLLDDVSGFDRFFRLIAGRRNIYVWLLLIAWGWIGGANAYRLIAIWSGVSAAVHIARAISIHLRRRRSSAA